MIFFIGGAARTGKGILARRLLAEWGLPYLSLDVLKMGLARGAPEYSLDPDAGALAVAGRLWPLVREMSASLLHDGVDYLFEGELLPKDLDGLRQRYPGQVRGCFLSYSVINPAQKLLEIRTHAGHPNDWPQGYADADLLRIVNRETLFSRYLEAECARYDFGYFETSDNFTQAIDQAARYMRGE